MRQTGDFGTSPIFEQLSGKHLLASIFYVGRPSVKHNSGSRNCALIPCDDGMLR